MTLPSMRVIEGPRVDVTVSGAQALRIMEAVRAGVRSSYLTNAEEQPEPDLLKEVCMTRFNDPVTDGARWAVEVWDEPNEKETRDYTSSAAAISEFHRAVESIGL